MQQIAIFLSNHYNKQLLIQQLLDKKATGVLAVFNDQKAQVFSTYHLQQYLLEEEIHGFSGITTTSNQSLRSMSSGEQKKVLLQYLLSKQPSLLILDNVFDNLDIAAQASLREQVAAISKEIAILQLLHRTRDLLACIEDRYQLTDEGELIPLIEQTVQHSNGSIPLIPLPLYPLPPQPKELVAFRNVNVSYDGRPILQQINWTVEAGEFWQLKGPNGSGKTTMLTMITGDNVKGYGQDLYLFGRRKGSGETVWEIKEKIGYLTPAMIDLFNTRHTLEQMIISGYMDSIGLYTIPTDLQKRAAHEWMQLIQLESKAKTVFAALTPGEQRMALIARAMVKHPPLLILDEPLAGLDDANAMKVIQLINQIAAGTKSAIIYVSHQTEPGLQPQKVFTLTKTEKGSVGNVG